MAVEHRVVAVVVAIVVGAVVIKLRRRGLVAALAGVSPPAAGARRGRQWLVPFVVGGFEVDDGNGEPDGDVAGRR
ncbi:hypothetical protein QYE76_058300 [Lolium multiflorum]|uniref:Uncharacterized protein n=1 Tax=Lolium multiflorum TaxID=4521 RepID=A0AAD8T580_LOLMU|nr:hypothetical protein QYE76_058300 [Lolium multiflorum]